MHAVRARGDDHSKLAAAYDPAVLRRGLDWCIDLQRRYSAAHGQVLAAGITLYGFLALFALLVLAVAVLGFLSDGNADLAHNITSELGLHGHAARVVTTSVDSARRSRGVTTVVGAVGILWLGSSWAAVMANAYDAAWRVPNRGLRDRAVGLLWLAGLPVLAALSGGATALFGLLPGAVAPLVVLVTLAANTALWLWTSWVLPNRRAPLQAVLVPAGAGGVALEVLKVLGAFVVPHYVTRSSELYGTIGVVFGLLLWLLILGRLVVYIAVLEAKRGAAVTPAPRLE